MPGIPLKIIGSNSNTFTSLPKILEPSQLSTVRGGLGPNSLTTTFGDSDSLSSESSFDIALKQHLNASYSALTCSIPSLRSSFCLLVSVPILLSSAWLNRSKRTCGSRG